MYISAVIAKQELVFEITSCFKKPRQRASEFYPGINIRGVTHRAEGLKPEARRAENLKFGAT